MIIVNISGSLSQQLSQYAFGFQCAKHLQTELKLDLTTSGASLLINSFVLAATASTDEINTAKNTGIILETTLSFDSEVWNRLHDGVYLSGTWIDHRYSTDVSSLNLNLCTALSDDANELFEAIYTKASVSLDLRVLPLQCGQTVPTTVYYNDAVTEIRERVPDAYFFIFCDDAVAVQSQFNFGKEGFTLITSSTILNEAQILMLMAACKHHIVNYDSTSYWAARLNPNTEEIVIAPQEVFYTNDIDLIARYNIVTQPIWPSNWIVLPSRLKKPSYLHNPALDFKGGTSLNRPIRVGVSGCYEHITTDGYLFKNMGVANGTLDALKPWHDLFVYGQINGIEFVTLDQVTNVATDLDALIISDRHKADNALCNAALQTDIVKFLIIYECPLIKPENWDIEYHKQFDRIFTWNDQLIDGHRYIKNNFTTSLELPYDFKVLKSAFDQRKLVMMINSAVLLQDASQYPTELYTHRIRTIRWFEAEAPDAFDLYGMGWDVNMFPSYKGKVRDKLAVLSHYRFAICYENAQGYSGYISEKIQDCLLAGVIPIYGGAPNISRWIPSDCYIDINRFKNYEDLHAYLVDMDAQTHSQYLDRIQDFFTSEKAYPFSSECFVTTLTKFLTWDVQGKHGDVPELAIDGVNAQTHQLEQDITTMQVNVVQKLANDSKPLISLSTSTRQVMAELRRDDLIIAIGYGPELPVFLRARALWQFYVSHFPNIKVIFIRDSDKLLPGEVVIEGDDLVIGQGPDNKGGIDKNQTNNLVGYAASGTWSATENERTIFRQIALYDYLLTKYEHPFYLAFCTITSVLDFRGLIAMLDTLPREKCFAGMLGRLIEEPYQGVGMVHGANTVVSRDVMELMRSRYIPGHEYTKQPNDHWQGLILPDIERTALPLFSFNKPRTIEKNLDDITQLTSKLIYEGHYQFRVKTTSEEAGMGKREDVDPWIMLKIMETILSTTPSTAEQNKLLQHKFALCCRPEYDYPRNFPIDDSETDFLYSPIKSLLAINIPTYERLESFSSIMIELENEINSLEEADKKTIEINVFENNSTVASQKRILCEEIEGRSGIRIRFEENKTNIGADRNILQCCTTSINAATFTWVLGDDDHVVAGCIPRIVSILSTSSDYLGLLVLLGEGYKVDLSLRAQSDSYFDFAKLAMKNQPHFLIAHTLISCNIFRSDIFDCDESSYVLEKLTPRHGLTANFTHMWGIVGGLLRSNKNYSVFVPDFISLDTSKRLPSEFNIDGEMAKIYYFYYLWLLAEIGVRPEQIAREQSMWWLFS